MEDHTERALSVTSHHFVMFSRNGRWGTCGDCPRDSQGNQFPELCPNTTRGDHLLTIDSLAEQFNYNNRPK